MACGLYIITALNDQHNKPTNFSLCSECPREPIHPAANLCFIYLLLDILFWFCFISGEEVSKNEANALKQMINNNVKCPSKEIDSGLSCKESISDFG